MADDGGQQRKPDFRTAVEDVKAIATVLAMEAESVLGRRTARFIGGLVRTVKTAMVVVVVLLGVLLLLYVIGLLFGIALWNLVKVLAIPITVGAAVPLLTWLQKKRELEREAQRTRDTAAQQYLDQLTQFLLDKKDNRLVRVDLTDDTRDVISARTDAILRHLDKENQQSLVEFLHGLGLLNKEEEPVVSLAGLDFAGIDWRRADLRRTDLREVDLSFVNLEGADLEEANLERARLLGANLRDANLHGAYVTMEQLEQAGSLEGAIMPNGQRYEDWIKGRGEDGEDSGPS